MKRYSRAAFLWTAVGLAVLSGCGGGSGSKSASADLLLQRAITASQVDDRAAAAVNDFGLRLTEKLIQAERGKNVFVSPVSLSTALSMTLAGAEGSTREEMAQALGLSNQKPSEIDEGFAGIMKLLNFSAPGLKTSMANSIWLQKDWPLKSSYRELMKSQYDSPVEERDLTDPKIMEELNAWVKEKTHKMIPVMFKEERLPGEEKMLLINALAFKGEWAKPFEKSKTRPEPFKLTDGSERSVPMMHQSGEFVYDETEDYQLVRLPYVGGKVAMVMILPRPDADPNKVDRTVLSDPALWTGWNSSYPGDLYLPKLHIEGKYELIKALTDMGIGLAFTNKADFSKMADVDSEHPPFHIGSVKHAAYLQVDEEGTEAAAGSAVEMLVGAAPMKSFVMKVDRPFWLAIVDENSQMVLFLGKVEQP